MSDRIPRGSFLRQVTIGAMTAAVAGLPSPPAGAEEPGPSFRVARGVRQLFLDDVGIERTAGLRRVVNPPTRHPANPVLKPDTPWESRCQVYGTALYDPSARCFKLWYLTTPKDRGARPLILDDRQRAPHTTLAAYAESPDGVRWTKPHLGIFSYDGNRENNLLGIGRFNCEGISVLHEPHDPDPQRRWKAAYWDHGSGGWEIRDGRPFCKAGPLDGWHVAFSPDGVHWTPYEGNPVLSKYCDSNQNVVFDPHIKKYVGFSRFGFGRRLARTESDDFLHWSDPQLVLQCDEHDGPETQIYGAGVDLYEGVYVAMIWIYRQGGDGKIDTQLATSRDGLRWTRVGNRATWLALGGDDSWQGGMVRSVERIIHRGRELYIYYCGVHGAHTGPKHQNIERRHPTQIGLLVQRRDGFVSLDAGDEEGTLITPPFSLPKGRLFLNTAGGGGKVRAALLDTEGELLAESDLIQGDFLEAEARFTRPLPSPGSTVRLRLTARHAKLFSYWFD